MLEEEPQLLAVKEPVAQMLAVSVTLWLCESDMAPLLEEQAEVENVADGAALALKEPLPV